MAFFIAAIRMVSSVTVGRLKPGTNMKLKTVEINGKQYAEIDTAGLPVYVHDDGKEIGFDAPLAIKKITELNGEAKNHRLAKEAAEEKLAKFAAIEDPKKAIEALEMLLKIDQKKLIDAGQVDQVKAEITKNFQQQLDEEKQRSQMLETQLYDSMIGGSFAGSKNVAIEKNNRLIKESAEITAWRDSLQASIDNRQQGYDIQIAGYGVGDKNQQRQQELLRIEHGYNNQRLQLERDYADKSRGMSDHVFQEKMQALNDALEREKEIVRQKNEQLDIQAGDWVSGASQGFNNWLDDTKDISEQIKSTTTQMFDGMTDALGDFVTTGKANFRSFATSVISDLSRIALKASITGIFDSISNSSSGGILGTIGSAISKFIPNAKGGVYESPSLSTYSNGIYDSPQFFAFAKGAGVFGEAGPEAIMPLTRTSDGSLGVRAINSKSGNGGGDITYAPVYQITIQNDGQNGEIGPQAIKALMGMVDQRVQGNLLNMRRDGGMLSG